MPTYSAYFNAKSQGVGVPLINLYTGICMTIKIPELSWQEVFHQSPLPMILIAPNPDGFIVAAVNEAASRLFGAGVPMGKPIIDWYITYLREQDRYTLEACLVQAFSGTCEQGKKEMTCLCATRAFTGRLFKVDNRLIQYNNERAVLQTFYEADMLGDTVSMLARELDAYMFALDEANAVSITDASGIITYVNRAFCELTQYTEESLLGKTHRVVNSGRHNKAFFAHLWQTIKAGKIWRGQIINRTLHGEEYPMDTSIIPIIDEHGSPYKYMAIRVEKERRKQAETKLLLSEEKYRSLFNKSPIPMWIYDVETLQFMDVNEAALRNYGYSREEFLSMTIRDIRPQEDVPLLEKALAVVRQNKELFTRGVYRLRRKNGEVFSVMIESNIISLHGRKAEIILATDITGELDAQLQLQESNHRLRTAQEIAEIGYWSWHIQEGRMEWSTEVYEIFGIDKATHAPDVYTLQSLFHPQDRHLLKRFFSLNMPEDDYYEAEHRIITPAQQAKWIYQRVKVLRNQQGKPIKIDGILRDITRSKVAQEQIKRKNMLINATNTFVALLLKNSDWLSALNEAFGIIGDVIGVDRVYYFENSVNPENGELLCSQRIEWSRNNVAPQINNPELQLLPYSRFGDLGNHFGTGVAFQSKVKDITNSTLRNMLEEQHIRSLLIIPVFQKGVFHGFIGFDDCIHERTWQEDEVAFLTTISSHLETVLSKQRVEQELQKNQIQLESVIANMPGITYRCVDDAQRTLVFISKEVERLTGYRADEFTRDCTRRFIDVVHPDDLWLIAEAHQRARNHQSFQFSYRIVTGSGRTVWVREQGRGIYAPDGSLQFIDGVIVDISELKFKEQQINESNERFRMVLKASREALIDWDIANDVTIWGDGFRDLFGYNLEVYDNNLWSRNIHPDDKERVLQELAEVIIDPEGKVFSSEFRFIKANGEVAYVHHKGIFVRDAAGTAIRAVGSLIDLTEAHQRMRKIEQQNKVLKEVAWTQSHVVRAPLSNILGLIGMIKDREKLQLSDAELQEIYEALHQTAHKLDGVVRDIVKKAQESDDV